MPLNPAVERLLEAFAAAGRPALAACTPAQARELMTAGRAALGPGPAVDRVQNIRIAARSGEIGGRLYRPTEAVEGLLVYFHGGGWVLGTLDDFDAVGRVLAARSGCAVLLVDYRLAPETPFPGGLEDAIDASTWASQHVAKLARPDAPLVIGGDSAGANLATVAAAELRDRIAFALQLLIYPVTDADFETASYRDPANSGLITREDMIWFFDHYVPREARSGAGVAPLRRADLAGLPAAHVVTAEYDVLRDEGEAYAARLQSRGIPVSLRRYDGLPHGFVRLHNLVPEADEALTEICDVLKQACRAAAPASAHSLTGAGS